MKIDEPAAPEEEPISDAQAIANAVANGNTSAPEFKRLRLKAVANNAINEIETAIRQRRFAANIGEHRLIEKIRAAIQRYRDYMTREEP